MSPGTEVVMVARSSIFTLDGSTCFALVRFTEKGLGENGELKNQQPALSHRWVS